MEEEEPIYSFELNEGWFHLSCWTLEVWQGENRPARPMSLRQKVGEMLQYLLESAPHPRTRDEILRAIWTEDVMKDGKKTTRPAGVSPGVVKGCMAEIRRALRAVLQNAPLASECLVWKPGKGWWIDVKGPVRKPKQFTPTPPTARARASVVPLKQITLAEATQWLRSAYTSPQGHAAMGRTTS
jgi:hypothetical protein